MTTLATTSTIELVAKLFTATNKTKFNGKVYAGFIYVNDEKIAVDADFETTWKKANTIWSDDDLSEQYMDSSDEAQYEFVINFLNK